eukprot:TRINITY_DN71554_c0_g1_i1.p2 TRINITY_DN71554_c0_g1~~TRINITY_DN71554_c0_g1_i1.p2  ORF type:complete len:108 (+),score=21.98 TRINITY_DN71554_c0_g1_i1:124-447(+)
MTKINYSIKSFADLDREEQRVKKRLKKQEELIRLKLKTLPEEIVTTGITKVINGILSGNLFQYAGHVVSLVKGMFGKKSESHEEEENSQGGGIVDLLKTVLKNKFSK